MNPLVSIIIPVYNSEKFLKETIESALSQTWTNKEIIIIDDGSTDNSYQIAKNFENQLIKIFKQENKGASSARNYGLRKSKGEFIQFLDADDLLSNNKIEKQLEYLINHPENISLCSTIHFNDGEHCTLFKPSPYEESFIDSTDNPIEFLIRLWGGYTPNGSMVSVHAWLIPKNIISKAGPWNENLTLDDDGDFFARVILNCSGIYKTENTYCYYRKFKKSASLSTRKNNSALYSLYNSTLSKEKELLSRTNKDEAKKAISKLYFNICLICYPINIKLFKNAYQKAFFFSNDMPNFYQHTASYKTITKIFGWKTSAWLSYLKRKLRV